MTAKFHPRLNPTSIFTRRCTPAGESRAKTGMIRAALAMVVLGLPCAGARAQIYTTLNDPLATSGTFAVGISGSNIVGYYYDGPTSHGFEYSLASTSGTPEPGSVSLLTGMGITGAGVLVRRRRNRAA